jgi:hypothetical protein
MTRVALPIAIAPILLLPIASHAQVDEQRAQQYFKEAAVLCERDGGRLWGISLCGPMVFADPVTRSIATNQPAPGAPRPATLGYAKPCPIATSSAVPGFSCSIASIRSWFGAFLKLLETRYTSFQSSLSAS